MIRVPLVSKLSFKVQLTIKTLFCEDAKCRRHKYANEVTGLDRRHQNRSDMVERVYHAMWLLGLRGKYPVWSHLQLNSTTL